MGIFGRYIFWHCESLLRGFDCLFGAVSFLKTLDFRPKIYESQKIPKLILAIKNLGDIPITGPLSVIDRFHLHLLVFSFVYQFNYYVDQSVNELEFELP